MDLYVPDARFHAWLIGPSLSSDIRRLAFDKVAALSMSQASNGLQNQDFNRLSKTCCRRKSQSNGFLDGVFKGLAPTSRVPMVRSP
jgi:hypothetical protein